MKHISLVLLLAYVAFVVIGTTALVVLLTSDEANPPKAKP